MGTGLKTRLVLSPWYISFPFFWTTTDISFFLQLGLPDNYYHHLCRLQRRYRAQTTRYASFGPLVSFFLLLFVIFLILTIIPYRFLSARNRRDPNDGVNHTHTIHSPPTAAAAAVTATAGTAGQQKKGAWDAMRLEPVSFFLFFFFLFTILIFIFI